MERKNGNCPLVVGWPMSGAKQITGVHATLVFNWETWAKEGHEWLEIYYTRRPAWNTSPQAQLQGNGKSVQAQQFHPTRGDSHTTGVWARVWHSVPIPHMSHLPWAERRVQGTWKGWAAWACWRQLRRQRRAHQSLCMVPLLLAVPTAEHHSWKRRRAQRRAELDSEYILTAQWFLQVS